MVHFSLSKCIPLIFLVHTSRLFSEFVNITNQEQYQKSVLENSNPVLVEFAADWCSVCKGVEKPFEKIALEPEFNSITFCRINIDNMDAISNQHSIVGVPTFVYIQQGKKVGEEIGINNMNTFEDTLRTTLRQTFKLAQAEPTQNQTMQPEQPVSIEKPVIPETQSPGFFDKVIAFITYLFMQIKELFIQLLTGIRSLFGY
jgi:thioredoxin 1